MKKRQGIFAHGWIPLIFTVLVFLVGTTALIPIQAVAIVGPTAPAGSIIGNQASASYTDSNSQPRTVVSNMVSTVVQQVAGLTLVTPLTKYGSVNSQVVFPLTLTNTGNGPDTFKLTSTINTASLFQNIVLYPDADGNGIADSGTPIDTTVNGIGPVPAGGTYKFVAVATVLSNPTPTTGNFDVTATSVTDATKSDTVNEIVNVTTKAVVNVVKDISVHSGPVNTPVTYTLKYTNTGNADANTLTITDVVPVNMTYVTGSGRWSGAGSTALTDASGESAGVTGIDYQWNSTTHTITAIITTVSGGTSASGWLTFNATVNTGVNVGAIDNSASFTYVDQPTGGATITGYTNTVQFMVTQFAGVTLVGQTVGSANPGATVKFKNTVTNTGNGADTFNITIGTSSFPSGSTFVLCGSDGETPLLDTNNDGIPDTGPVALGGHYDVYLKVTLPSNASGGPYTVKKWATSVLDSTVKDDGDDTLSAITAATVDVTINKALPAASGVTDAVGNGTGSLSGSVNPNASIAFTYFVNNTSVIPDSYQLSAVDLPGGFSLRFENTSQTLITNTGILAAGANLSVKMILTPNSTVEPKTYAIKFTVTSPTTGATDYVTTNVTVNTIRNITITPDYTGQITPGGSLVFRHTITNNGNVKETTGSLDLVINQGFTGTIYKDDNSNGILDPTDTAINDISGLTGGAGIAAGQTIQILVKVYAPASAAVQTIAVGKVTLTITGPAGGINGVVAPPPSVATETITVIAGEIAIIKKQAKADATGTITGSYSTASVNAKPGEYLRYQITVTNTSATNVTGVVVNDATPQYTVYDAGDGSNDSAKGVALWVSGTTYTVATTAPSAGSIGSFVFTIGTLTPGQMVTIYFGVKINP